MICGTISGLGLWWLFSVQNVSIGNWEWNKLMLANSLRGTNHNGMISFLKEHSFFKSQILHAKQLLTEHIHIHD